MNDNQWGITWQPHIDKKSRKALYLKIVDAVVADIKKGVLNTGDKLPPIRPLSYTLGCNSGTVYKAYQEIRKRGFLIGEIGRGSYIKAGLQMKDLNWPNENSSTGIINLSNNYPSVIDKIDLIITKQIKELANFAYAPNLLQYQHNSEIAYHIEVANRYLKQLGCLVDAKRKTIVTSGATHGGFMALLTLTGPGDLVLTEEFTSQSIIGKISKLNLRVKGIAMDKMGIIPSALQKILEKDFVKVVYLMPNLHNPTTCIMSLERRKQVAKLLSRYKVFLIEDDVFGGLLKNNLPPITSFLPKYSFYITSFSKIISPALRVGYLNVPDYQYEKTLSSLRVTAWMASPLMVQLATNIFSSGLIKDMIKIRLDDIKKRQKIALDILHKLDLQTNPHSMHLWVKVPEPFRAGIFADSLRKKSVAVIPSELFAVDRGNTTHAIRISLTTPDQKSKLKQGLSIIAKKASSI